MEMLKTITWIVCWVVAAAASYGLTKVAIPALHRLKFGQTIREEGPAWHKAKQGTPTMGGIVFIGVIFAVVLLTLLVCTFCVPDLFFYGNATVEGMTGWFAGLLMAGGFGVIGFLDDYIKVVKKRNLGLTSRQKLLLQIAVAVAYTVTMVATGNDRIHVPFVGYWDAGFWYVPIGTFIIVAIVNATNLTDGVDGLCGTVTVVVCCFLLLLCGAQTGYGVICSAAAGALTGFLMWNLHPARVFMGDTGSLFIGGLLCAVAFGLSHPLILLPMGAVYTAETLSVVLQVSYFKLTGGKRLFKMSPLHHHFELCGWSENKIVAVFSAAAGIGCVIGLAFAFFS